MCDICSSRHRIDFTMQTTTIEYYHLTIENNIMSIRKITGYGGYSKPIVISYCPFCGEKLGQEEE